MLHGLAGKPEILNTVAMLSSGSADLACQTAEDIASDRIYNEQRLASNPMQRGETPLADSRFPAQLQLRTGVRQS